MCVVCLAAPVLMAGGGTVGVVVERVRLAVTQADRRDDSDAWAAAARGERPAAVRCPTEPSAS